jgi:DNA helicase-2/ATP-dependent DNA helicase PcrA
MEQQVTATDASAREEPETDIHAGLNPEQLRVVDHQGGPLLVAAVAGCGKTRVIVHRIAQLVRGGVAEDRILAVTFSVKAAREMNMRLTALGVHSARVGTFHSLSWQLVRTERPELSMWQVDDRDRYRTVVKDALGYRNMDWKTADLTVVLSYIGRCKAAAALPGTPAAEELARRMHAASPGAARDPSLLARAYFTAEELRRERKLLTYDDMLLEAWTLLSADEGLRQRWASRWDHVMQDECQDENIVQRDIASMLARDHRCYMVVGDPAQSIYGFRGSDPTGMLRFGEFWNAMIVGMARNYRSGRAIVNVANKVIDAMAVTTHLGVKIAAERDTDGSVDVTRYASFDEEGQGVVGRILEEHADGRVWKDCAVLYRTNAQSRGVEEALLSERVPYVVLGGTNFYERKEVKDLLAYLRIAAGRGSFDDIRRAINTPFRYLGKAFLEGIDTAGRAAPSDAGWTDIVRKQAETKLQQRQRSSALQWCALIDNIANVIERGVETEDIEERLESRPARVLESLVMDVDYMSWLTRDEGTESPENNRMSNVRELIRAAERFPTVGELLEYIDETLRKAAEVRRGNDNADCVVLASLHRAKGLEWPSVHIIGCNQKILPHARAEDAQEERRLFYVGITRARDALHLSCVCRAAVGAKLAQLEPSAFIAEVGLEVVDHGSCSSEQSRAS